MSLWLRCWSSCWLADGEELVGRVGGCQLDLRRVGECLVVYMGRFAEVR